VLSTVRIFTIKEDPIMAHSTQCEAEVALVTGTEVGEILQCPDCGLDLEVVSLEPPVLAPAPEEEEDWGE
jgi:alpha-aminoadipate carrier protein LysW